MRQYRASLKWPVVVVGLIAALLVTDCGTFPVAARVPVPHRIDGGSGLVAGLVAATPVPTSSFRSPVSPATPSPVDVPPWPSPWVPSDRSTFHVPILTYHVVAPWSVARAYARPTLAIDPVAFDAQLRALQTAGWHAITVRALADAVARNEAPPPRTFVLTLDDGHSDGFTYALPILERYGFVATFYVVAGRVGEPDNLSWTQVEALAAAGMEIGDHTLRHQVLTKLTTAQLEVQVDGAQARFLAATGSAPTTFAYPFGSFDPSVVKVVADAGFHMAVTTSPGAGESWAGRFVVPRIEIGPSMTPSEVVARVSPYR